METTIKRPRGRPKKIKNEEYHLVIYLNGDVHKSLGNDLLSLLKSFIPPVFFKTKTVILATRNGRIVQRYLKIHEARMLFGNKVKMELFANNLSRQLN